jgi:hypothetical protein
MTDPAPPPSAPPDAILSPNAALPALQKWFGDQMVDIWKASPIGEKDKPWIVLTCPVWGPYVAPFINFVVPTLLSPENVEALAPCWIVIWTDAQGWPVIWENMHRLESHGLKLVLNLIPDYVMAELAKHDSNKYWGLSVAHNLGMRVSGRIGAGFHMLAPDHLYGPRYFKNLKRLSASYDIVAQTGVSSNRDTVLPELQQYRHPRGWITVPDRELGNLAWTHLHPQTQAYIMNNAQPPDLMPGAHFLVWQGEDYLATYCCHQNASWLSPRVCVQAPNFIPATIDTRLPYFAEDFYVPTVEDEMTFIEFSGANKFAQKGLVNAHAFAARCWAQTGFSTKYLPYFMWPSLTPIHPQKGFMTDDAIKRQHREVAEALLTVKPPVWMETLQSMMVPT